MDRLTGAALQRMLETKTDLELRQLNIEHPFVNNDGNKPEYELGHQVVAEGKRRGLW